MATNNYTHGDMNIDDQKKTWDGFLTASTWGSLLTILVVAYPTFAIAIGMDWMVSLGLTAIIGFASGFFLKLGGRWIATMIGLIVLALIVQGFIMLFGALT